MAMSIESVIAPEKRGFAMLPKMNETLVEIGKRLRGQGEDMTREPLPERWVDLINYLDEQERRRSKEEGKPEAEARDWRKGRPRY